MRVVEAEKEREVRASEREKREGERANNLRRLWRVYDCFFCCSRHKASGNFSGRGRGIGQRFLFFCTSHGRLLPSSFVMVRVCKRRKRRSGEGA
jgi:hypothetical protein